MKHKTFVRNGLKDVQSRIRKGWDLEVCYINETIVEEEASEEEESEIEEVDPLRLAEQELYDEYHYEEDYWDHIKVF